MKKYQYQLIRYVHDHFTGEFVNIGIIIYAPEERYLKCKTTNRYMRVKALFPQANGRFVNKILKSIELNIKQKSKELSELFHPSEQLDELTKAILPKDNSSIQLAPVQYALDINMDAALNDLSKQLVDKYMPLLSKNKSLTDNDVWQEKYKKYFEELNIADKLVKHTLQTNNDEFEFEKAWKNNIWHCYQPISFALQEQESIKDKVYRWFGRLKEIQSAEEPLHLTFLTSTSKSHKELNSFIKEYLTFDEKDLKTEIVGENEARNFAKRVKEQMAAHDNES